jgi:hypothetical protein
VRCDIIIDPYFERRTPLLRTELSTANAVLGSATQRGSELDFVISTTRWSEKLFFVIPSLPSPFFPLSYAASTRRKSDW